MGRAPGRGRKRGAWAGTFLLLLLPTIHRHPPFQSPSFFASFLFFLLQHFAAVAVGHRQSNWTAAAFKGKLFGSLKHFLAILRRQKTPNLWPLLCDSKLESRHSQRKEWKAKKTHHSNQAQQVKINFIAARKQVQQEGNGSKRNSVQTGNIWGRWGGVISCESLNHGRKQVKQQQFAAMQQIPFKWKRKRSEKKLNNE
jgi:hypothetical protein